MNGLFKFVSLVVGEALLLLFLFFLLRFQDAGVGSWFHNPINELTVFGSMLIMLLLTGLFPDFLHSFVYGLKEPEEITAVQVKRSLFSVKLAMVTAVASQLLVLVFLFVSVMQNLSLAAEPLEESVLVVLAAYGGNAIYGILAVIILLPVYARLKVRLL